MALGFKEVSSPNGVIEIVRDAKNLGLSRTLRGEFLARRTRDEGTGAERKKTASMGAAISVNAVSSVDVGVHGVQVVGTNGKIFVKGVFDVFEGTKELGVIFGSGTGLACGEESLSNKEVRTTGEGNVEEFADDAVKILGSGGREEGGRRVNLEKVALGGSARFTGNGAVVVAEGLFEVSAHGNGDVTGREESDGHAEEFVGVATSFGERAKTGLELGDDIFHNGGINVGDHGVIDIPGDGALRAVDGGIGDARVIGVEGETKGKECLGEELIPENGTFDAAIEGALHFEVEGLVAGFHDNELTEVRADVAHEVDVFASEFDDNKFVHEGVEVGAGNVGGDDRAAFETGNGEEEEEGVIGEGWGVCFVFGV